MEVCFLTLSYKYIQGPPTSLGGEEGEGAREGHKNMCVLYGEGESRKQKCFYFPASLQLRPFFALFTQLYQTKSTKKESKKSQKERKNDRRKAATGILTSKRRKTFLKSFPRI